MQQLSEEFYDPNYNYPEHKIALEKTGTRLYAEQTLMQVIAEFLVKITKHMMRGNFNFGAIIPPSALLLDIDALELQQLCVLVFQKYAKMATQAKDPIVRLKQLATGVLANFNVVDNKTKGLIPIPVFKNDYLEGCTQDGTYLFTRCVTQDPLIIGLRIVGPNRSFIFEENVDVQLSQAPMSLNSVHVTQASNSKVVFEDGTEYSIQYPKIKVENIISNEKFQHYINLEKNDNWVWDKTNDLKVVFDWTQKKSSGFIESWFKDVPKNTVHEKNLCHMKIFKVDKMGNQLGEPLSQGKSNIQSFVEFDGKILWKVSDTFDPQIINLWIRNKF